MTAPAARSSPKTSQAGRPWQVVAAATALAGLVCAFLVWLHVEQRSTLNAVTGQLQQLRQARIELANGFLHASLAGDEQSPFSHTDGVVLIRQAIRSLHDGLAGLDLADAAAVNLQHDADAFLHLIDNWRRQPQDNANTVVALRIAYAELERDADAADRIIETRLRALNARTNRVFVQALVGSSIALLLIVGIAWRAVGRHHVSLVGRARAEQALLASEARFQATFEHAAVGIAHVAPDGSWLRVNRCLCEIVGYPADELRTKTFQDITHPDDLAADLGQVERMLAGEIDTYAIEKRYIRKDGDIIWIRLTVALIWSADGRPDYFISVIEDIHEHKLAEVALRESEARYRLTVESAAEGYWQVSADHRTTDVNEVLCRMLGYARAEMLGRHPAEFADAENRRIFEQQMARIPDTRHRYYDITLQRKDGSPIALYFQSTTRFDDEGGVAFAFAFITDLTERKRAEAELMRRNQELERFDRNSVGRELEMIALKREVNRLSQALGQEAPYDLSFAEDREAS